MKPPPRVYIDFDDVLCETAMTLTRLVNGMFDKGVRFEDISSFDLTASFRLNEEEEKHLFDMFHDETVLREIEPVEGALAAVRQLDRAGFDVHVVTGRPPSTHHVSREWLEKRDVPHVDMTFVDKYLRGHANVDDIKTLSLDELKNLDFALAIEDSLDMACFLAEEMALPVILLDRPWNSAVSGELSAAAVERITRCNGWPEAVHVALERISNGDH